MTPGHPFEMKGKLQEVQVEDPIEPRGWSKSAAVFIGFMAAGLLCMFHLPQDAAIGKHSGPAVVEADVAAEGKPIHDKIAKPPVPPASKTNPKAPPRIGDVLTPERAETQAPFVEMGAMTSDVGEDKETFLLRVAQTMDLFTRTTQHEICAVIMVSEKGDAYRVRLTTNRSHVACSMVMFDEPGFKRLGPDIHSHPREYGGVPANARDVVYRRDFTCGQKLYIFDDHFSQVDFDHGAGYLVSRGRLLYQHGEEWPIRQVAVIEPIEHQVALQVGGINPQMSEQLATSAWKNEDREGVPVTACPPAAPEPVVVIDTPPAALSPPAAEQVNKQSVPAP